MIKCKDCIIGAIVKSGESRKQLPLVFILMSRQQKEDYIKVFEHIVEAIRNIQPTGWFFGSVTYTHNNNNI